MAPCSYTLLALAVLLMVAATAEASVYRTTVTTVEETVEPNDGEMERCREEMRRHHLGSCRRYMRYGRSDLLMAVGNQEVPEQCCSELRRMSEPCRCPKIKEMAREMMQERGREMREEEMVSRAENLPATCGMRPQHCSIRQIS